MANDWTDQELDFCVRAYMWMLNAQNKKLGNCKKKRVDEALRAGPLKARGKLDYRFANISSRIEVVNLEPLQGYKAQSNVGSNIAPKIDAFIEGYMNGERHQRRIECLISSIPHETIIDAAEQLISGTQFQFPESRNYDVIYAGALLAPKRLIAYAAFLYFGIPLGSDNFTGAINSPCFRSIESAGLRIIRKGEEEGHLDAESPHFRKRVSKSKATSKSPPKGNKNPKKTYSLTASYQRDSEVVAAAEERADGHCELCGQTAPFNRSDGTPFLEGHHVIHLSNGGSDTLDNVAALCPNCHRECHHGQHSVDKQQQLLEIIVS